MPAARARRRSSRTPRKRPRGLGRRVGHGLQRARRRPQEVARADVLRHEPQQPHGHARAEHQGDGPQAGAGRSSARARRARCTATPPGAAARTRRRAGRRRAGGRRGGARTPTARGRRAVPPSCHGGEGEKRSASARQSTATTPATTPPRRAAIRNAIASASSPPARATTSHRLGAASSPNSEKTVVNSTGSGFQDGPASVTRSPSVMSRPQISHAHGSYVGCDGGRRETPRRRGRRARAAPRRRGPGAGADGMRRRNEGREASRGRHPAPQPIHRPGAIRPAARVLDCSPWRRAAPGTATTGTR